MQVKNKLMENRQRPKFHTFCFGFVLWAESRNFKSVFGRKTGKWKPAWKLQEEWKDWFMRTSGCQLSLWPSLSCPVWPLRCLEGIGAVSPYISPSAPSDNEMKPSGLKQMFSSPFLVICSSVASVTPVFPGFLWPFILGSQFKYLLASLLSSFPYLHFLSSISNKAQGPTLPVRLQDVREVLFLSVLISIVPQPSPLLAPL